MTQSSAYLESVFHQMTSNNYKVNFDCQDDEPLYEVKEQESMWMQFLDAVQTNVGMEKLKNYISMADTAKIKHFEEQEEKRLALEKHFINHHKKKFAGNKKALQKINFDFKRVRGKSVVVDSPPDED